MVLVLVLTVLDPLTLDSDVVVNPDAAVVLDALEVSDAVVVTAVGGGTVVNKGRNVYVSLISSGGSIMLQSSPNQP